MTNRQKYLWLLSVIYLLIFAWSLVRPHDYFIWFLEVAPIFIGLGILFAFRKSFQASTVFLTLFFVHALILTIGAHYTYAEVPLFNWIRDYFQTARNSYDAVGHLAQGFMPAIYAREVLLKRTPLVKGLWLFVIVVCICLAFSAAYELIEWLVAISTGTAADAFLGSQGDIWDTQKDMALALVGAIIGQLVLGKVHDRSMQNQKVSIN